MTKIQIIAGGAGFVGVNLLQRLLEEDTQLVVLDNLSRGRREYLSKSGLSDRVNLRVCDLSRRHEVRAAFAEAASCGTITQVWHLAANSDIPAGIDDPDVDLRDTFLTTFEILQAMREFSVRTLHLASSSAIYGDHGNSILKEDTGPLLPISNYGAMKLASEAQATAASELFLDRVNIFRFPNVVGVPATHGVLIDFVRKLNRTPAQLDVLGDGQQQKAYLHVADLIDAMLVVRARSQTSHRKIEVVNIGPMDNGVTVRWIAEQVVANVSPSAQIVYGSEKKGWIGDVSRFIYSTDRLRSFGWSPKLSSDAAILRAIREIASENGFHGHVEC